MIRYLSVILLLATACFFSPPPLFSAETPLAIRSETILRARERPDSDNASSLRFPVYEYLSIDYGQNGEKGLSAHFYGWGSHDLAGSDGTADDPELELIYGYLNYTFIPGGPEISVGRQTLFTGLRTEHLDGFRLTSPVTRWFEVAAYGGIPYADGAEDNRRDQQVYGGRIAFHPGFRYAFGLNYQGVSGVDPENEEKLAFDLFAALTPQASLTGYSALNAITGHWAEHDYELSISAGDFMVHPLYQYVSYSDFFDDDTATASPFRFLGTLDTELSIMGGDVYWRDIYRPYAVGVGYKHYDYGTSSSGADYVSGTVDWAWFDTADAGIEFGLMGGDAPENRFLLYRIYAASPIFHLFSRAGYVTGEAMFVDYDVPIYETDHSLYVSLSYVNALFRNTELVVSGDYTRGPYFDSDISGTVIIRYAIDNLFSGGIHDR